MELIVASTKKLTNYARTLREGLEVSSGARSTSTYYHSKDEQRAAIRRKVIELYRVDKSIPLLLASLEDATHYFRQEVLLQELRSGAFEGPQAIVHPEKWIDAGIQDNVIDHILSKLPFTYVLRFFVSLKKEKVNNARTRGRMIRWVIGNLNDFSAMKYRNKMRQALLHAYGVNKYLKIVSEVEKYLTDQPNDHQLLNREVFRHSDLSPNDVARFLAFVERKGERAWYGDTKFIKAFYDACHARTEDEFFAAAEHLDNDVARGIVSNDGICNPLFKEFYEGGKLKKSFTAKLLQNSKTMTDDQKVRTKDLQKRSGSVVRADVDYSKVSTETLYKTEGVLSQRDIRAKEDKIELPYRNIGIIVDKSLSNRGGQDSKGTPAAIIEHLEKTLLASVNYASVAYTSENQTDLSKPLVEIIDADPTVEAIFVLSDGYENYPYEGCFSDLMKRLPDVQAIHCSPYVSAEMKAQARSLGENVISLAINKPSQITTQMQARLLDFDPRQYFENQFSRFLPEAEIVNQ